jgi:hypothetical protein
MDYQIVLLKNDIKAALETPTSLTTSQQRSTSEVRTTLTKPEGVDDTSRRTAKKVLQWDGAQDGGKRGGMEVGEGGEGAAVEVVQRGGGGKGMGSGGYMGEGGGGGGGWGAGAASAEKGVEVLLAVGAVGQVCSPVAAVTASSGLFAGAGGVTPAGRVGREGGKGGESEETPVSTPGSMFGDWVGPGEEGGGADSMMDEAKILKSHHMLTLFSRNTRVLTFEDFLSGERVG